MQGEREKSYFVPMVASRLDNMRCVPFVGRPEVIAKVVDLSLYGQATKCPPVSNVKYIYLIRCHVVK